MSNESRDEKDESRHENVENFEQPYENNPFILRNCKTGNYTCKEHREINSPQRAAITNHMRSVHNMLVNGSIWKKGLKDKDQRSQPTKEDEDENLDPSDLSPENQSKTLEGIRKLEDKTTEETDLLTESARYIAKDIAVTATKIATNLELGFIFSKMKQYEWTPIDISYDQWIAFHVMDSLIHNWHVKIDVNMDFSRLNKEQIVMLKEIKTAYEKYK